jgi:GIY-YIG catalytic domain
MDLSNIENDIIFGRVYMLYNTYDKYFYIGSTVMSLRDRMRIHIMDLGRNRNSKLYNHFRKIDLDKWKIKLLEGRVVENITELRQIEQKWIDKYNKDNILNEYDAVSKNVRQSNNYRTYKNKIRNKNADFLNELKNFNLNNE